MMCHLKKKTTHSRKLMNILSDDNSWRERRVHQITTVHLTCRFDEVGHRKENKSLCTDGFVSTLITFHISLATFDFV